jgi:hypothetical protein
MVTRLFIVGEPFLFGIYSVKQRKKGEYPSLNWTGKEKSNY